MRSDARWAALVAAAMFLAHGSARAQRYDKVVDSTIDLSHGAELIDRSLLLVA